MHDVHRRSWRGSVHWQSWVHVIRVRLVLVMPTPRSSAIARRPGTRGPVANFTEATHFPEPHVRYKCPLGHSIVHAGEVAVAASQSGG